MARNGHNPATYLAGGVSIETHLKLEASRPKPSWAWESVKAAFLADVLRTRREDTHRDYRGKLLPAELERFAGRPVTASRETRWPPRSRPSTPAAPRRCPKAMVRMIKRFWSWL
jgi:hypothetical protein